MTNPRASKTPFDPTACNYDGINMANVRCPCGGTCCDITVGLVERMGVKHYECDTCHTKYAKKVS